MHHKTNHPFILNMHLPRHPIRSSFTNPICSTGKEFFFKTTDTPQKATNGDKHRLRALLQHGVYSLKEADYAECVHIEVQLHGVQRDVVNAVGGVVVVACVGNHGVDVRDIVGRFECFDGVGD